MAGIFFIAVLATATSAIAAPSPKFARQTGDASTTNVTLTPVTASNDVAGLTPNVNVTLPYGYDTTGNSVVNIALTTISSSVLLESISSVTSVDCASDSVSVTFDTADDLASAYSQWSSHPQLVLITNHMGDCDTEIERGFFTADSYTMDADSMLLVATAQKSTINDIACKMTLQPLIRGQQEAVVVKSFSLTLVIVKSHLDSRFLESPLRLQPPGQTQAGPRHDHLRAGSRELQHNARP